MSASVLRAAMRVHSSVFMDVSDLSYIALITLISWILYVGWCWLDMNVEWYVHDWMPINAHHLLLDDALRSCRSKFWEPCHESHEFCPRTPVELRDNSANQISFLGHLVISHQGHQGNTGLPMSSPPFPQDSPRVLGAPTQVLETRSRVTLTSQEQLHLRTPVESWTSIFLLLSPCWKTAKSKNLLSG